MINEITTKDITAEKLSACGNLEYPVEVNELDLTSFYLGYVRWHWHEEIEIHYVQDGCATFLVGDESIILSAGEALFINENVLHSIHPIPERSNRIISIVFHPDFILGHGQTYLSSTYLLPILDSKHLKYMVIGNQIADCGQFLESITSIIRYNSLKPFGYELATKAHLCQFWLGLLHRVNVPVKNKNIPDSLSQDEIRTKQAMMYIDKHYYEPLTLEDLSNFVHISRSELCRCFKRVLKMTPFQYLVKYRIFQSARIIRTEMQPADSISDLAVRVGFNNTSYYNKLFKKYMHCTPTKYKSLVHIGEMTSMYHQQ